MLAEKKKLLKTNKFLSFFSSGSAALFGILTFALLARFLSKEDFGFWGFFIAVFTLFDMLRAGLLSNAIIKNLAEANTDEQKAEITGSGWRLNLMVTVLGGGLITLILLGIAYFTEDADGSYLLMSKWFGILALVSMPHSMGVWVFNANLKFIGIIVIRSILQGSFLLVAAIGYWLGWSLNMVLFGYFISNVLTGTFCLLAGWTHIKTLSNATKRMQRVLFNFGKFSMGTLVGSNLLKSTDTFVIQAMLGPKALAIYQVPEKLLGLIEIPLRALISIAFPQLAKTYSENDMKEFQNGFEVGSGFSSLFILPISVLTFVFAEPLVVLLGGKEYADSAHILQIFAIYTAITPLDRFTGITLDVLNRPDLNFYKVLVMLGINLFGNIAVLYFSDDVAWVAFVSIITFSLGMVVGLLYLKKYIQIRPGFILKKGFVEIQRLIKRIL